MGGLVGGWVFKRADDARGRRGTCVRAWRGWRSGLNIAGTIREQSSRGQLWGLGDDNGGVKIGGRANLRHPESLRTMTVSGRGGDFIMGSKTAASNSGRPVVRNINVSVPPPLSTSCVRGRARASWILLLPSPTQVKPRKVRVIYDCDRFTFVFFFITRPRTIVAYRRISFSYFSRSALVFFFSRWRCQVYA